MRGEVATVLNQVILIWSLNLNVSNIQHTSSFNFHANTKETYLVSVDLYYIVLLFNFKWRHQLSVYRIEFMVFVEDYLSTPKGRSSKFLF